ncbi:MAG: Ig-like domain-containing protein [Duncaniella sp.]|nr:Ig-like domain-containing protein [Duncaniella sp.]
MRQVKQLRMLLAVVAAAVTAACANMGRPEGGPRDETPPVYTGSNPAIGQLNVKQQKISVSFDENISLDDPTNKIVVSPAQKTQPAISSNGRNVTVELRDSLLPNTTYIIDFSDAVKDLNEGNVLDGLALDFSTGESIDSMRISGMVFEARNLEPAQGMIVGAYSNLSDTAITTLPVERITKTNQLGQFVLRGLKPDTPYRIFAINDVNRDYHWDRSEDIAFYPVPVTPTCEQVTVNDTLRTHDDSADSIVSRLATHFMPDDLLLTWFNEGYASQYLKDYKREVNNKITMQFGTKADSLPIMRLLNTHRKGDEISTWSVLDASATLDTLTYWITDTALAALDSILIEARYYRTDTLDNLTQTSDTLKFFMRGLKLKKKEEARKKKKEGEEADTLPPVIPPMDIKVSSGTTVDLNKPLYIRAGVPVARFDSTALHMEMQVDTLWYPVAPPKVVRPQELRPMDYVLPYTWEEGTKYRLKIDSAAVEDIYGLVNKEITHEFTTKTRGDYSTLSFNISGLDGRPAVVEVLGSGDKLIATAPVQGSYVKVEYLNPGTYYARLYIDSDSSGEWTTGNLLDSIQPEEVYYYPKKITLKKNWNIDQSWNINELPVDQQKPRELVKNKPKRRKGERDDRPEGEEEEEDEFFDDPFMNNANRNNGFGNTGGGRFNRNPGNGNLRAN